MLPQKLYFPYCEVPTQVYLVGFSLNKVTIYRSQMRFVDVPTCYLKNYIFLTVKFQPEFLVDVSLNKEIVFRSQMRASLMFHLLCYLKNYIFLTVKYQPEFFSGCLVNKVIVFRSQMRVSLMIHPTCSVSIASSRFF